MTDPLDDKSICRRDRELAKLCDVVRNNALAIEACLIRIKKAVRIYDAAWPEKKDETYGEQRNEAQPKTG